MPADARKLQYQGLHSEASHFWLAVHKMAKMIRGLLIPMTEHPPLKHPQLLQLQVRKDLKLQHRSWILARKSFKVMIDFCLSMLVNVLK